MPEEVVESDQSPPVGLDWGAYVQYFVAQTGGWAQLSDELLRRSRGMVEAPTDPQSVQKGLRRLAGRENKPGGQYGRWLVRLFGVPEDTGRWVRYLGQYHRRFADLPTSLRLEQLRLWDRPPTSESSLKAWVDVGTASVFQRMRRTEDSLARLAQAEKGALRAGPAAELEVFLFRARLATDSGATDRSTAIHEKALELLDSAGGDIEEFDRHCYRSRLAGQRGYILMRPKTATETDIRAAQQIFEELELPLDVPFACYQRSAGLAYCAWRLGDLTEGERLARRSLEYAADAGLVRFRIMAMNQLAKMVPPEEAERIRAHASRLSGQLEDEDLKWRVERHAKLR